MKKCSFSTAALFPRDSAESLKLIGKAGFEFAELMPQCFSDVSDEFASRAEKCGVRVGSVHYPLAMFSMLYNAHGGMCVDARDFGRRLVRLCARLGASVLVIHPHEPIQDPQLKALLETPIIDSIVDLAAACEKAGIRLAMENNPKGPGRSPDSLLLYIASFSGRANLVPMVDTTEACEAGEDPVAFIVRTRPAHMHMSDHSGEKKHLPAGEGEIKWNEIRDALRDYDGLYTLEPSYRYYLAEPEERLVKAHDFISRLVEGR